MTTSSLSLNRRLMAACGACALAMAVAACGGGASSQSSTTSPSNAAAASPAASTPSASTAAPSSPSAPASSEPAAHEPVSGKGLGDHVHNLALVDGQLWLGTHQGLYVQEEGQEPRLVSEYPFDVMGLVHTEGTWFASGHSAPGQDAPSDLGLQRSSDGVTWEAVSLEGEVDFHRLTAHASVVAGIAAYGGRLLVSPDGGSSWLQRELQAFDIVAGGPDDTPTLVATREDGPVVSTDLGETFTAVPDAPLLMFVAWDGDRFAGITPQGEVYVASEAAGPWTKAGEAGGQPGAFAATKGAFAVLVDDRIVASTDGGRTFAPRIVDVGGH